MISLEQYKNHLINSYRYEIDNTDEKREERKQSLERQYDSYRLHEIIHNTYEFIKDVLKSETLADDYCSFPIPEDTTSYISLNLAGGYFSDVLYKDHKGRTISRYIIEEVLGDYIQIEIKEDITEREDGDIVYFDYDYSLYLQGFPKNIEEIKQQILDPRINVIFLDFDGVLDTMSDPSYFKDKEAFFKKVEPRIATLADICKSYNCKIVIEAAAKEGIDEVTMELYPDSEWLEYLFNMFKKYNIDVIGRTPNVKRKTNSYSYLPMWKDDEIRLYLFRHPEVEHYCVLDDDDTKNMLHWKVSDLEKVREHLVSPLYYSENPEEEGLLPKHKEEVGRVLTKENEIRKFALRKQSQKK